MLRGSAVLRIASLVAGIVVSEPWSCHGAARAGAPRLRSAVSDSGLGCWFKKKRFHTLSRFAFYVCLFVVCTAWLHAQRFAACSRQRRHRERDVICTSLWGVPNVVDLRSHLRLASWLPGRDTKVQIKRQNKLPQIMIVQKIPRTVCFLQTVLRPKSTCTNWLLCGAGMSLGVWLIYHISRLRSFEGAIVKIGVGLLSTTQFSPRDRSFAVETLVSTTTFSTFRPWSQYASPRSSPAHRIAECIGH